MVTDMEVDMVVDMEVDKVADMEVDMVADMVADQVANIDSVTVSLFSFQLLISQTRTKELKCSETLFDGKCVQPTFVSSKALQVYSSSTWTIINTMIAAFLCPLPKHNFFLFRFLAS